MHVFVDESERNYYLVCAVLVPPELLHPHRRRLRQLLAAGERRIHFNTERPTRRRMLLSALTDAGFNARLYIATGDLVVARDACVRQLVKDLANAGPVRLILESRSEARDLQDRHSISAVIATGESPPDLTYEHLRPHEDPLLWAPDAIAWAYGAGGDWRRRVEPLVQEVTKLN